MNQNRAVFEQDLILVYAQGQPLFFARIEKIESDVKKGWWRVTMLVLQIPVRLVTWILDEAQIRGAEFTMGGIPIKIEIIVPPTESEETEVPAVETQPEAAAAVEPLAEPPQPEAPQSASRARILSMGPRKE
jgi:hypothetical protein